MASSTLSGQCALLALPVRGRAEQTPDSFPIPVQLKIGYTNGKKKGTASGVLGNGMDVIKIAEVCFNKS